MTDKPQTFQILNTENTTTVIDLLFKNTALSKQKLKLALSHGAVWLQNGVGTQRVRKAKKKLKKGDILFLYYHLSILQSQPTPATLVQDFTSFSIWHKPYGMFCQGSKWGDHCTINRWVETQLKRPTFIVHRLDRATTGLMILAHSKSMAQYFSQQFQQRKVKKIYHAKVAGQFPKDEQIIQTPVHQQTAYSIINRIAYEPNTNRSLLKVEIKTGRKHQIRLHLSQMGYPIIGDRLYGSNYLEKDLQLCCQTLAFSHPSNQQWLTFTNPKCG